MTWRRSLRIIDAEIAAKEAKLRRVVETARPKHPVGHGALAASLHEQLAVLWREHARVLGNTATPH